MGPLNHTWAVCSAGRSRTIRDTLMDDFKTLVTEQGIDEENIVTKPDQGNDDTDKQFFKKLFRQISYENTFLALS